jgi:hypothetical protein
MAGTFAEQSQLAADAALAVKVKAALIKNATLRLGAGYTPIPTGATSIMARAIIADPASWTTRWCDIVAYGNPTTSSAAPVVPVDGDVDYIVNSLFDILAG